MDCPACNGSGEIREGIQTITDRHGNVKLAEEDLKKANELGTWPFACPRCGGNGYFEE